MIHRLWIIGNKESEWGQKGEDFIKNKIESFQKRCKDDQIDVEVTWFELNFWKPVKPVISGITKVVFILSCHGPTPMAHGDIDVGDGCWTKIMLVTSLWDTSNIKLQSPICCR